MNSHFIAARFFESLAMTRKWPSLAQGVQMTACPQIYFVFGNGRSADNLSPAIVPRQNLQCFIEFGNAETSYLLLSFIEALLYLA